VQHIKTYLPCNFEVNLITHLGVIALFSSFFFILILFVLYFKNYNYPKTWHFTICSIFSNSGHVGWCTASPDTILKLDTLVMMIQTKLGFNWSSSFRGEDFWKKFTTYDDGRQRTYGKMSGFWIITQKPLIISEIWHAVTMISTARSTHPAILK
jgi:hypothetical protein